jgi:hypothetical protein
MSDVISDLIRRQGSKWGWIQLMTVISTLFYSLMAKSMHVFRCWLFTESMVTNRLHVSIIQLIHDTHDLLLAPCTLLPAKSDNLRSLKDAFSCSIFS